MAKNVADDGENIVFNREAKCSVSNLFPSARLHAKAQTGRSLSNLEGVKPLISRHWVSPCQRDLVGGGQRFRLSDEIRVKSQICMTAAGFHDARKSGFGEGLVVDEYLRANRKYSLFEHHSSYLFGIHVLTLV